MTQNDYYADLIPPEWKQDYLLAIKKLAEECRDKNKEIDRLNALLGEAGDEKMLAAIRVAKLNQEIDRLNYFLGQNSARISGLEKLMIREESITNDENIKY